MAMGKDSGTKPLILVADDDEGFRCLICQFLENHGYAVCEAKNGREALEIFRENRPELILMDADMPGLDGIEACADITWSPDGEDVAVIIVTGFDDEATVDRAYDAGAVDYITKPIHWAVLRRRIENTIYSRRNKLALQKSEGHLQLAASVFTCAREGIAITDPEGTIIDVNEAFSRITGYQRNEVVGKNPRILKSGRQGPEYYASMWRDLVEKGHWFGEIWNRRKNGGMYADMLTISAVLDEKGATQHYVALFADITAIKEHQYQLEHQLEHLAHFDALTGLPNRVLLTDRLHQAMAQTQRHGHKLAVAYIDLDGFRAVNDSHGHEVGDELLITVAGRMKQALREGDTLSRLGGDEFIAVLPDLDNTEDCTPVLTRLLAAAADPVHVAELALDISASIGVSFYPQADDMEADQLQRQADQAMYQAKLEGKNRYYIFDPEQDRALKGRHDSLEQIRQALNEHEFVLYYQPKVNMRTGTIIGAEALIRWQHPKQGLLLPGVFLPVIEDHPLAIALGEWVIDTALAQIEAWYADGLNIPISINIGAQQLQQRNFATRLRDLLSAHPDVSPQWLELEVLETGTLGDMVRVSNTMRSCREMGVSFALDDFGTGYSSLVYLKRLPVDVIKIDRSFVRDMLEDPEDLAILEGVLGLATSFHLPAIAEGVETPAQSEMLLQLGCKLAQGYTIARPMPAADIPGWARAWANLHPVDHDDLPLLFAKTEHRAWIRCVEDFLNGERLTPPPENMKHCNFRIWMNGEGQTRFSVDPMLQASAKLHRQVHELVDELLGLQARGRNADALARLEELHTLREKFTQSLDDSLNEAATRQ